MSMTRTRKPKKIAPYLRRRMNLNDISSSLPLLRLIHDRGPTSQSEASLALSMTTGACNLHFQRLEHAGLIQRVEKQSEGRGRPTLFWDIDFSRNYYATLVFDVPFCQFSLMDFNGQVIHEQRDDLTGISEAALLTNRIDAFLRSSLGLVTEKEGRLRQVAALFPGLLDPVTGAVASAVNFPALNGLDARGHIEEKFGVSCYAGSLGLAFYFGETERLPPESTCMVIHWDLGLGVTCGTDGHPLTFPSAQNPEVRTIAEIGHIRVGKEGRLCHCGNRDCLEAFVGGWALIDELDRPDINSLDTLISAVVSGDEDARRATEEAASMLARQLAWPIQLMSAERIVVTGPMAPAFDAVRPAFCKGLEEVFTEDEIRALSPEASSDPQERMRRGAFLLASRLFLYPEDYGRLPRSMELTTRSKAS
ncbi:MAG: ROK family protein [Verrucomicrobia bacterium]|nr:ROK family protein [Verrucomicrobiota bacterium]